MTVRSPAGEDSAVAGIGGHNDVCALLMNEVFLHFRRAGEGVLFQGPQGQKKAAVSQGAESFAGGMVGILAGKSRPGGGNGAEPGERRRPPPARLTLAAVYLDWPRRQALFTLSARAIPRFRLWDRRYDRPGRRRCECRV